MQKRASDSGPTTGSAALVARAFHAALSLVFADAFLSLGVQVQLLIGSRGLLPLAPWLDGLRAAGDVNPLQVPTLFWLGSGDTLLSAGIGLGFALSAAALLGLWPRLCLGLATLLYLSYTSACREFLSFQWDNLLVECGALAVLLPRDRPARLVHLVFRALLFKLYWESGLAKWQSPIGDWADGTAMTLYYETAPLPTALAWYAHHLPDAWHHFESRATLVVEGLLPLAVFGPRSARWLAFVLLSGFQALNLATANYGFFCWLALALHLFLLDDRDLARLRFALVRSLPALFAPRGYGPEPRAASAAARWLTPPLCALWLGLSLASGLWSFSTWDAGRRAVALLQPWYGPLHVANSYHLFAAITPERIEPDFQTLVAGEWLSQPLHYKPGPLDRAPPFVAPHQPRVDFRLWFYGLRYRYGVPDYARTLLERLCREPEVVQPLFASRLPAAPRAARIAFRRYHFSSAAESAQSGSWWTATWLGATGALDCARLPGAGGEGP